MIEKRSGKKEKFDGLKIYNAVMSASRETVFGEDEKLADEIAIKIKEEFDNNEVATVEEIQDRVEVLLMESSRKDIAKQYILYRNKRLEERGIKKSKKSGLLSEEFLSKYKHIEPPMTELGKFVYYRTYSRFLHELGRRENWWETVRRAVEYTSTLMKTSKEEAEALFDDVFNLRQLPSMRTMWIGGTSITDVSAMANLNCSFVIIDDLLNLGECLYLMLCGSGLGFRVLERDVEKIPKVRSDVYLINEQYIEVPKKERKEHTSLEYRDNGTVKIIIGDSREGWVEALKYYLEIVGSKFYKDVKTIIFNYDNIRPEGEPLKNFGGYASGHTAILKMLTKIHKVISSGSKTLKLRPIHILDMATSIAEGVVVGGTRRSALICLFSPSDTEVLEAKSNLFTQQNGDWVIDKEIEHRQMSNNTIVYEEKPTREFWHWHLNKMRYSGEPGILNLEAAKRRNPNAEGVNPCLSYSTKILTVDGYKKIGDLENKEVEFINKDGAVSKGKVWCSGEKELYRINLSNKSDGKYLEATKDHVFMLIDGTECKVEDLGMKRIMPYVNQADDFDTEFVKYGFIQGDGCTGRLSSKAHRGLEVNIGIKDTEVAELFNVEWVESERSYYVRGFNEKLIELGFSDKVLPERCLPTTIDDWSLNQKRSFLRGLYSANGNVLSKSGRIAFKTTCKKLVEQLQELLEDVGIYNSYITTNKAKDITFSNGTYTCKESYDLNIGRMDGKVTFYNTIGFLHDYKNETLKNYIEEHGFYVTTVKATGRKEKVFDFSEPLTHWGVVEDTVCHNCGEILLDNRQNCNLATVNMASFVKGGKVDTEALEKTVKLNARLGYRMTNLELELPKWDITLKRDRLEAVNPTGYADLVNACNLTKDEEIELLKKMRTWVNEASDEYADSLGLNRSLLKTALKPSGNSSTLLGVSPGIHYPHSEYYIRRVRVARQDPLAQAMIDSGFTVKPEVGQDWDDCSTVVIEFPVKAPKGKTKYDVTAIEQLENYKMWMDYYTEHNNSITISVKDDEWEEVEEWVWNNWDEVIALSFLSLSDSFYQLMPYEAITKEQYEKLTSEMPKFSQSILSKYEKDEYDHDLEADGECSSASCPIR